VAKLRPNARYELKANHLVIGSLQADLAGCIQFVFKRGYVVPQKFELDPAARPFKPY
jgi:hypothetical protein